MSKLFKMALEQQQERESVAVDLDGTLAEYDEWLGIGHIGKPIPAMVELINDHLAKGDEVTIFTARVANGSELAKGFIEDWCVKVFGRKLDVTAEKLPKFTKFYDDRAVQVIKNEGIIVE
jgi:hypothetical protein